MSRLSTQDNPAHAGMIHRPRARRAWLKAWLKSVPHTCDNSPRYTSRHSPREYQMFSLLTVLHRTQTTPNRTPLRVKLSTKSGANGTRTRNPLLAKQVRYQLRHSPKTNHTIPRPNPASGIRYRSPTSPNPLESATLMPRNPVKEELAGSGPSWARTSDLSLIRTAL